MARLFFKVACMAIALSMVSLVLAVPDDVAAGSPHDPILIRGNQEFTAANGVVGGSGTAEDPYVIEGWQIYPTVNPGIHIIDTTTHFVIRDVIVQGTSKWADGPMGVFLEHATNFQINAVDVSNCMIGIIAYKASDSIIGGCTVHENMMGIRLTYSKNVTIEGNTVFSNGFNGIGVATSDGCFVNGNLMTGNRAGLALQYSRDISVSGNIFNRDGITISGMKLSEFDSHTITPDNLVGGLPVYYYAGVQGMHLEGIQAGEIILAGCENIELVGLTFAGSSAGIEIGFSEGVYLDSCTFQNNIDGLLIWESYWIDIRNCLFSGNENGLRVLYTEFVIVYECQFDGNLAIGISMYSSIDVLVGSSTFTGNFWAIDLQECSYVIVSGNLITANSRGVSLDFCTKSWVYGNEISYNDHEGWGVGIEILGCKKVVVDQNNFIGNDIHALVFDSLDISWDNGWSVGNYWDNYTGTDANNDLVGDTPYVIDSNDQDNFPHMTPFPN